ncbi:transmembrane protein 116-like [Dysidea avara]|uniref:transmembrane protein 116-like n=1 Tax=Dysidea avara TaxID=196820 RepID=UPI00332EFCD2
MDGAMLYGNHSSGYLDGQHSKDERAVSIIRIVMSSLSILGAATIIVSALIAGKISNAEVHPIFMLSVADFILAICWLLGGVLWLQSKATHYFGFCYFLAIATVIAEMITFLLTMIYAITALLRVIEIYHNEGSLLSPQDKRKKPRHTFSFIAYIIVWTIPVVTVIPTILKAPHVLTLRDTDTNASGCQVSFTNVRPIINSSDRENEVDNFSEVLAGYLLATFALCAVLMTACYLLTLYYVKKIYQLQEIANPDADTYNMKWLLIRVAVYVVIFFFVALPSFVATIIVLNEHKSLQISEKKDNIVIYWQAVATPLQGALNAAVYGWSRKSFRYSFNPLLNNAPTRNYGATPVPISESSLSSPT